MAKTCNGNAQAAIGEANVHNEDAEKANEEAHLLPVLEQSAFAAISATMGWETFHLVETLWHSTLDLPPTSKEKNWELQVRC